MDRHSGLCPFHACGRNFKFQKQQGHGGVYGRRTQCRGVDFGLVLRHSLLFRGNVYRLFRQLGMELWAVVGPGGPWQRGVRLPFGLARAGKTDPGMYQKIENQIDAPVVRNAV